MKYQRSKSKYVSTQHTEGEKAHTEVHHHEFPGLHDFPSRMKQKEPQEKRDQFQ